MKQFKGENQTRLDPDYIKEQMDIQGLSIHFNSEVGMKKVYGAFRELIMEIKYRNHNPKKDCDCDVCKVCNELLNKLEDYANINT